MPERDGSAVYEENLSQRRAKLLPHTPQGRRVPDTIRSTQRGRSSALGAEIGRADLRQASTVPDRLLRVVMSRRPRSGSGVETAISDGCPHRAG
jgi:hypothetical protein